jgi:hypothetical protein
MFTPYPLLSFQPIYRPSLHIPGSPPSASSFTASAASLETRLEWIAYLFSLDRTHEKTNKMIVTFPPSLIAGLLIFYTLIHQLSPIRRPINENLFFFPPIFCPESLNTRGRLKEILCQERLKKDKIAAVFYHYGPGSIDYWTLNALSIISGSFQGLMCKL